jgi:hypothetical protein
LVGVAISLFLLGGRFRAVRDRYQQDDRQAAGSDNRLRLVLGAHPDTVADGEVADG